MRALLAAACLFAATFLASNAPALADTGAPTRASAAAAPAVAAAPAAALHQGAIDLEQWRQGQRPIELEVPAYLVRGKRTVVGSVVRPDGSRISLSATLLRRRYEAARVLPLRSAEKSR